MIKKKAWFKEPNHKILLLKEITALKFKVRKILLVNIANDVPHLTKLMWIPFSSSLLGSVTHLFGFFLFLERHNCAIRNNCINCYLLTLLKIGIFIFWKRVYAKNEWHFWKVLISSKPLLLQQKRTKIGLKVEITYNMT